MYDSFSAISSAPPPMDIPYRYPLCELEDCVLQFDSYSDSLKPITMDSMSHVAFLGQDQALDRESRITFAGFKYGNPLLVLLSGLTTVRRAQRIRVRYFIRLSS